MNGLVDGMTVLALHGPVDAFGARVDNALNIQDARSLQHIHHAHHVNIDGQRGIGLRNGAHESGGVHDVADLVFLDGLQQTGHVHHVAQLDIEFVEDVSHKALVAMPRIDDWTMSFANEPPGGFGADHAHAACDQYFHNCLPDGTLSGPFF